jgi:hypothetical protein
MSAPYRIRRRQTGSGLGFGAAETRQQAVSDYVSRLTGLIPGEVLALYLTGQGVIPDGARITMAVWALFCFGGVIALRVWGTRDQAAREPVQWPTVLISAISFVIWVYSIGGPFAAYGLRVPHLASLLVLGWTFVVPIVYRGDAA